MLQGSAAHEVTYDQRVYAQSGAQAGQHQNCTHHSLNSTVPSVHICQYEEQEKVKFSTKKS